MYPTIKTEMPTAEELFALLDFEWFLPRLFEDSPRGHLSRMTMIDALRSHRDDTPGLDTEARKLLVELLEAFNAARKPGQVAAETISAAAIAARDVFDGLSPMEIAQLMDGAIPIVERSSGERPQSQAEVLNASSADRADQILNEHEAAAKRARDAGQNEYDEFLKKEAEFEKEHGIEVNEYDSVFPFSEGKDDRRRSPVAAAVQHVVDRVFRRR